jgi:hypothetical protein
MTPEDRAADKALHASILQRFQTRDALEQFAYYELGISLDQISMPGDLNYVVFRLISWARQHGKSEDLRLCLSKLDRDDSNSVRHPIDQVLSALPVTARGLVGRDEELRFLDACREDPSVRIVVMTAFGGVGKTALVRHWIESRFVGGSRRPILGVSFYSQGVREQCGTSDQFLYEALSMLGDQEPARGSLWLRGRRLGQMVSEQNVIIVLDGLEPLQYGHGYKDSGGRIRDPGISEFLRELSSQPDRGFCIVTTRVGLTDEFARQRNVRQRELDLLAPEAAEALLRSKGVRGDSTTIRRAARHLGNHSLALVLAAELTCTFHDRDAVHLLDIALVNERTRAGRHAKSVMAAYEAWMLRDGFRLGFELLLAFGLFERPVERSWFDALCAGEPIPDFPMMTETSGQAIDEALERLRGWRLVAEGTTDRYDTHPLIRDYFAERLRNGSAASWTRANAKLFAFFRANSEAMPADARAMDCPLQAVVHGCRAGMQQTALHEVLIPKIMRGAQCYATTILGLHGPVLAALLHFFDVPDADTLADRGDIQVQGLSGADAIIVLVEAAKCLTALRGYAAPAVEQFTDCALEIVNRNPGVSLVSQFEVWFGRWRFFAARSRLDEGAAAGERLLQLAERSADPVLKLGAFRAISANCFWQGIIAEAESAVERGIAIDLTQGAAAELPSFLGDHPRHICLAVRSICLALRGYEMAAIQSAQDAIEASTTHPNPHSRAVVMFLTGYTFDLCGGGATSRAHGESMASLCLEFGFRWWLAAGLLRVGWSSALLEPGTLSGENEFREGMEIWRSTGATISLPYWKARQAEMLLSQRRIRDAVSALEDGLSKVEVGGERWFHPELLRLRGECGLLLGEDDEEALALFSSARRVAAQTGTLLFECKAAISEVTVLRNQGRDSAAQQLLVSLRERIVPDADAPELRHVQRLCEAI